MEVNTAFFEAFVINGGGGVLLKEPDVSGF